MKRKILILILIFSELVFSQKYHDTQGKLEVSSSGQATFTLPIAIPPSIQSVGPTINLKYQSGQQGGIAGQGWSINSISYINRMATSLSIEGFKDGVDFDDNDKLSLDGQRLLIKSGDYWADGSEYQTEVQSNVKIQQVGTYPTIYFIVTAPDGSRSYYGNFGGMNATDSTAWYIVKFEDTKGNYILYNYVKPFDKNLCIDEILFSANTFDSNTPLNKIKFNYKHAVRVESTYIRGDKIEKAEILNNIEVFTNNNLFRKYQLYQQVDPLVGYERVTKIEEINGQGEKANPILFTYGTTQDTVGEITSSYIDPVNITQGIKKAGDFDGDGRLDYIIDTNLYTKLFAGGQAVSFNVPFAVTEKLTLTGTTILNNKLNQKQSLIKVVNEANDFKFEVYNLNPNGFSNDYSKIFPTDTNQQTCVSSCDTDSDIPTNTCPSPPLVKNNTVFYEGDFNGDGVSEVLILRKTQGKTCSIYNPNNLTTPIPNKPPVGDGSCQCYENTQTHLDAQMVDLNINSPSDLNTHGNYFLLNSSEVLIADKYYIRDFNGDGKADVLALNNKGEYKVISIKQLTEAPWGQLEIIGQGILENFNKDNPLFFGDYNGDGKIDFAMPPNPNTYEVTTSSTPPVTYSQYSTIWNLYLSNPKLNNSDFFDIENYPITEYRTTISGDTFTNFRNYFALDVNKDGKTDIVKVNMSIYQYDHFWDPKDLDTDWTIYTYINNIGNTQQNGFTADYVSPDDHTSNDNSLPIVLASDYKYAGINNEMLVIRYHPNVNSFPHMITYIDFRKDYTQDNEIIRVSQSNGAIEDRIIYKPLVPTAIFNPNNPADFYSSSNSLDYPNVELTQIPNIRVVYKLENNSLGVYKHQLFKYNGFSINLFGSGVIGFKKVARSSWYKDNLHKKTWSVTENNPNYRNAISRTFSKLLDGSADFSFPDTYDSDLIIKTENSYIQNTDAASGLYTILLKRQKTNDFLNNIITENSYNSYTSDYFLPENSSTTVSVNGAVQKEVTTVNEFENNPSGVGNEYYIGRPKHTITKTTAYNDSFVEETFLTYDASGNVIENKKSRNGSSETHSEKLEYFSDNNLKSKTVYVDGAASNASVTPRSVQYTYDATNRFIKTITSNDGLVSTNNEYDPLYGVVTSQTNPFGLTTKDEIDNWGKKSKHNDYLGNTTLYNYSRVNDIFITKEVLPDGAESLVFQDALSRVIKKGAKNLNGIWNFIQIDYDPLGRKIAESEPFFEGDSPSQWNTFEYDEYNRPKKTIAFTGKTTEINYLGLSTEIDDGTLLKKTVKDAIGNVVSVTDTPGGEIRYDYFADNALKSTLCNGVLSNCSYDEWGRKTFFHDPSANTFNYTYNGFGELLTETTPKGTTTFILDDNGKVLQKNISGDATDSSVTNHYDSATQLLLDSHFVDNTTSLETVYTYNYDSYKRLEFVSEKNEIVLYEKKYQYDTLGRAYKEYYGANAFNKSSNKWIKNEYATNGQLSKIIDDTSQLTLWQATSVNARGQLLQASLGNGTTINNGYDDFGYPIEIVHQKDNHDILNLSNQFEPITGNLLSRNNTVFDYKETFTYDANDRLSSITHPAATLVNAHFDTTVDDFVDTGNVTAFAVNNQRLKVFAHGLSSGTQRLIETDAPSNQNLIISADVTESIVGAELAVKIKEFDTDGNLMSVQNLGTIDPAVTSYTYNYTVVNSGATLFLCFEVGTDNFSNITPTTTPPNGNSTDALFYLDNVKVIATATDVQDYDPIGRISSISTVGNYEYSDTDHPYQTTAIHQIYSEANLYFKSNHDLKIDYNAFKAPVQIEDIDHEILNFDYNIGEQRSVMYYGNKDGDKASRPLQKYYSLDGSTEIKRNVESGEVTFITYIGGNAYAAPLLVKSDGNVQEFHYLHRDQQGTLLAITNAYGHLEEKRLFDAWGNVTKIMDENNRCLDRFAWLDRGYTGHEHLLGVGLINMNARLYDPNLHRFLQPDSVVQDPYNTQNYNRYSYCLNNPLKYSDISGNTYGEAIIIGAAIALAAYLVTNAVNGTNISFQGMVTSAVIGAVSGAVTFGIGTYCTSIGDFAEKAMTEAVLNGAFQGTLTAVQGGNFWNGFSAGCIASVAASAWGGGQNRVISDCGGETVSNFRGLGGMMGIYGTAGMITFGTISGGAGAALTGGNFWQGAVTGLIVSGLNHAMHDGNSYEDVDQEDPPGKKGTVYKISKEQLEQLQHPEPLGGAGALEYIEGSPIKGAQWIAKMGRKYGPETIATVEKVGSKYWKYTAEVAGKNGRTIYTKYLNMEGKTVQWFHDTYNASNKFIHREFNAGGGRLKVWWDGTREYINKF